MDDLSESTKKIRLYCNADDTTLSSTINTFNNEQSNVDTHTLINDELSKIIVLRMVRFSPSGGFVHCILCSGTCDN